MALLSMIAHDKQQSSEYVFTKPIIHSSSPPSQSEPQYFAHTHRKAHLVPTVPQPHFDNHKSLRISLLNHSFSVPFSSVQDTCAHRDLRNSASTSSEVLARRHFVAHVSSVASSLDSDMKKFRGTPMRSAFFAHSSTMVGG